MIDEEGRQQLHAIAAIQAEAKKALTQVFQENIDEARNLMDSADDLKTFHRAQGVIAAYKDMINLLDTAKETYEKVTSL